MDRINRTRRDIRIKTCLYTLLAALLIVSVFVIGVRVGHLLIQQSCQEYNGFTGTVSSITNTNTYYHCTRMQ